MRKSFDTRAGEVGKEEIIAGYKNRPAFCLFFLFVS